MDRGSELDKPCDRDSMQVISAAGNSAGGFGTLCGKNTGQHLYIPVNTDRMSGTGRIQPMIRIITDARAGGANITRGYKWNIKVTQIDCFGQRMEHIRGKEFTSNIEKKRLSIEKALGHIGQFLC